MDTKDIKYINRLIVGHTYEKTYCKNIAIEQPGGRHGFKRKWRTHTKNINFSTNYEFFRKHRKVNNMGYKFKAKKFIENM